MVGWKREVEAELRREGKMERRTEGGGMLVGGGPEGEAGRAGVVVGGCGVGEGVAQASQSQSEAAFVVS